MKKSTIVDIRPLIDAFSSTVLEKATNADSLASKLNDKHAVVAEIQTFLTGLISAFRKSYATLTPQEREKLVDVFIEKIESKMNSDIKEIRNSFAILTTHSSTSKDLISLLEEKFKSALKEAEDIERIEVVAQQIKDGEVIPSGRNRKPGTRPERLSTIRKAQQLIDKNKNQEQES